MLLGLRTVIYPASDLAAARDWFSEALGIEPYFDQPFYVGFEVAGYELALDPDGDPALGALTYWGVADVDSALAELVSSGAEVLAPVREVGDSIRVALVRTPQALVMGLIENPHFRLPPSPQELDGPGR